MQQYKDNKYDFIIMDLQIPGIDGLDVTKEIRKLEKDEKHTTIVALTASALDGDKEKCILAEWMIISVSPWRLQVRRNFTKFFSERMKIAT